MIININKYIFYRLKFLMSNCGILWNFVEFLCQIVEFCGVSHRFTLIYMFVILFTFYTDIRNINIKYKS